MEFDETKNDLFDFSSLEEIQPALEEIKETPEEIVEETQNVEPSTEDYFTIVEEKDDVLVENDEDFSHDSNETLNFDETSELHDEGLNVSDAIDDIEEIETVEENLPAQNDTTPQVVSSNENLSENKPIENSGVNINAQTIKVTATNVVLSGNANDDVHAPTDYSGVDSYKGKVSLASDEHVIREYKIVKGGGKAVVTNKRLVLDCDTRLDLPIEKVGGVASSHKLDVKVVKFIFGVLFVGICLFACLFDFSKYLSGKQWAIYTIIAVGGVFGLAGILMILTSFKQKFILNVFGDGLLPLIAVTAKKREGKESFQGIVVTGRKGKEFAKFTGEIGALLLMIKDELKRNS